MSKTIRLNDEDPTIFAKCPNCTVRQPDGRTPKYFGAAYSERKWKRSPACENCGTGMEVIFSISTED